MRNLFKKSAPTAPLNGDSAPEIFSLDEAMASASADLLEPIDSQLSREARKSAAQVIGCVRELLVGEHMRSMDGRFLTLQSALEAHYSQLVTSLTSQVQEVEVSTSARLDEMETGLNAHRDELHAQDEKVLAEIEVSNARSIALEEKLASAVTTSESEDIRIGTALAEGIEHIQALESRFEEKTNLFDQQQAEAQQAIAANTARMAEMENEVVAVVESLHQHDAKILENLQALTARVDALEENVGSQLEEMRQRETKAGDELAAAVVRLQGIEKNADSMGEGTREQMRQMGEYFSRQIAEMNREIVRQKEEIVSQMVTRNDITRMRAAAATPPHSSQPAPDRGNGATVRPQAQVKAQPSELPASGVGAFRNEKTSIVDPGVKVTLGDFAPFPRVNLSPQS